MTRRLKLFAFAAALWTAPWLLLGFLLRETGRPRPALASSFVVFTVVLSSLEKHFRAGDDQRAVRYNLPRRYSVVSASASAFLTAGWALAWRHGVALVLALGAASVLVMIAVGHLGARGRIKAYTKDELFP
jgi:hypothetical protein